MNRQKNQPPPLVWEIKPSYRLKTILLASHLLAGAACFANGLALPLQVLLAVMVSLSGWISVKKIDSAHNRLKFSEQSGWELSGNEGFSSVQVLKSTVITTYIIILRTKSQNKIKSTILVLSDALSEDDFRQLIVKLKTTVIQQ
jgi:toxin CptA